MSIKRLVNANLERPRLSRPFKETRKILHDFCKIMPRDGAHRDPQKMITEINHV